MSADLYPLNDAQRRRLTIFLAFAERDLQRLRNTIAHPPRDLLLTHYDEPIPRALVPILEAAAIEVEKQLNRIAGDLQLRPVHEPVRRSLYCSLSLDEVDLHELCPSRLRGFGEVAGPTADYLELEIRKLQDALRILTVLLERGGADETES